MLQTLFFQHYVSSLNRLRRMTLQEAWLLAGIAQNIATNAALTQGMAAATRQLGTTAAQQAGQALTTQYRY